jgi:peptide/nickel transport system permease protein
VSGAIVDEEVAQVAARISSRPAGLRRLTPALRLLRRSRRGMTGLGILVFFGTVSVLAPLLASQDPSSPSALSDQILASPSWSHPLGTDENGKDVLSELLYGGRVSLAVGLTAAAIATTIGTLLGVLAGFVGGLVDRVVTVLDDWFLVIPFLPIAILLISLLGSRADSIPLGQAGILALVIGCVGWAGTTRIVRSEVLSLRERLYVDRSRALGASAAQTMRRHILPNVMPLVLANAVLFVSLSILAETTLSFLGLGDPIRPSWGQMLNNSYTNDAMSTGAWWYFVAPGLCVTLVVMGFALVGYALESLVDPTVDDDAGP